MAIFMRESKTPTVYGRKVSKCRLSSLFQFFDHPGMVNDSSFPVLLFHLKSRKPEVLIVSKGENDI